MTTNKEETVNESVPTRSLSDDLLRLEALREAVRSTGGSGADGPTIANLAAEFYAFLSK